MVQNNKPRCHYDVLGVDPSADDSTIKKAHRRLALQWHPDKNASEEATHEFRLVQEAYECLSDKAERKWYDEHRHAILEGINPGDGGDANVSFMFDVVPFMMGGCYQGYNDTEDGFYSVYRAVFEAVLEGEIYGYKAEGNIELSSMLQLLSSVSFGSGDSDWAIETTHFYAAWASFSSTLSFAWTDEYDIREAPNRRVRRAMEEANRKNRKAAKRERNNDIIALVEFVKRRDPRRRKYELEKQKLEAERQAQMEIQAKALKEQQTLAREAWRAKRSEELAHAEAQDLDAGRIRLADLEDDYFYQTKGKKKGKKNRQKVDIQRPTNMQQEYKHDDQQEQTSQQEAAIDEQAIDEQTIDEQAIDEQAIDEHTYAASTDALKEQDGSTQSINFDHTSKHDDNVAEIIQDALSDQESFNDETSSDEEEEEVYRCECCRKDFKSQGQMNNHMESKKHKLAFKKYKSKKEAALMDDFINENM